MIRTSLNFLCRKFFDSVLPLFTNVRRVKISIVVYYGDNERYDTTQIFNIKSLNNENS